jgi:hypothetical protein
MAVMVAGAALGVMACENGSTAPDADWTVQLTVTEGPSRPAPGNVIQMGAFVVSSEDDRITSDSLNVTTLSSWSLAGDPTVATITSTGLLTAIKPGALIVQATYGGKSGNISLLIE